MRRAQVPGARTVMAVLLPDRTFAAPLVALGALLGSIGRTGRSLRWEDFLALPKGATIYLRMKDQRGRYVSVEGALQGERGALERPIGLRSEVRSFRGAIITPGPKAFFRYDVSREPHLTVRRARRLLGAAKVFGLLSEEFENAWMTAPTHEAAVVTNRALWSRRCEALGLFVLEGAEKHPPISLPELLMCKPPPDTADARTLLLSSRGATHATTAIPVGILDGSEALRTWEELACPNLVVLLDQAEYDPGSQDILSRLAAAREDELLPLPEQLPEVCPGGIAMTLFAIRMRGDETTPQHH
jgi:hypothetical protein